MLLNAVIIHSFFNTSIHLVFHLKGLGHVILGNFSTDQMVIELTKINENNGSRL